MMRGLATHHCSITAKLFNEESSPHSDLGTKCVGRSTAAPQLGKTLA
jgi:hypothetical protein